VLVVNSCKNFVFSKKQKQQFSNLVLRKEKFPCKENLSTRIQKEFSVANKAIQPQGKTAYCNAEVIIK